MTTEVIKSEIETAWREHCRSAVRKFVMNAVVVDNEPSLPGCNPISLGCPSVAQAADDGMGVTETDRETATPAEDNEPEDREINGHSLDVQAISDAFADQEIACAFVLPKETDPDETVMKRVLVAAIPADIVVIDWKLRNGNHQLTLEILKKIAEKDVAENGRLRLICVYTGEPQTAEIIRDAIKALEAGGLVFDTRDEEAGRARGKYHCLQVLSKQDEAGVAQLPIQLMDTMTALADGLLPAFSIAAVAAVRRNMHHIIARFPAYLDDAFVANLLITDPQEDVTELIRELFVSECDTALGLERVADDYLSKKSVNDWLLVKNKPLGEVDYELDGKNKVKVKITKDFISALLRSGIAGDKVVLDATTTYEFKDKKRSKLSYALHGDKSKAKEGESQFARFVSLKREAFGNTKFTDEWKPSLTLGTILRDTSDNKYFYCITPACDTIRLKGKKRSFVMLELEKPEGMPSLLIPVLGGTEKLKINTRPHCVRTFEFQGDDSNGRIMAKIQTVEGGRASFFFERFGHPAGEALTLEWLGEMRRNRASRDMAELNREWLRLGVKDSEYLRLASKGLADF
jgi:hypothetical protein